MLRILHITGLNSKKYGSIEQWVIALAKECKKKRYEVIFAFKGPPWTTEFTQDLLNTGAQIDIIPEGLSGIGIFIHIMKLINKRKINIINSHFSPYCHYANLAGWLHAVKGRFWTMHSMSEIDSYAHYKQNAIVLKQKISSILVHKIIVVSHGIRNDYIKIGVSPEKMLTIPLGVDIKRYFFRGEERYKIRREFGIEDKTLLIGTVSRAEPVKGLKYLVEGMPLVKELYPNIKALIVGGGCLMDELKRIASDLKILDSMIFEGIRDDIPEILSAIDIFVLPSLSEGMPLALLEAMACGRAVVGSNVGGIPEIIQHEVTGYLIPTCDPIRLAEAVVNLARHPELSSNIGNAGRRKVERHYNVEHQVKRLVDLYERALRE